MRKLVLTALVVTAAAVSSPAFAQDAAPFSGPRIGVIAGWDHLVPGNSDDSYYRNNNADGVVYGVDGGYDVRAGRNLVLGIDGEVSGSTAKVDSDPYNNSDDFGYGRVKTGRDLYLGGRVGFLLSPKTMIYGKAGYTNARLDLTANETGAETGQHFNLDGYRLGAGIEEQLSPHTYAKVEYRYSNYSDARLEFPNGGNTDNFDVDTDRHQIVAGVGFRF
jgi:outer membrane immunogenic protein